VVARFPTAGSHPETGAHIDFGRLCSGIIPHPVPDPIVGQQSPAPQGHGMKLIRDWEIGSTKLWSILKKPVFELGDENP
jgi:hypothetical protein